MTVKQVKDGDAIFNDLASMDDSRHSFVPSVKGKINSKFNRLRRHRSRSVETTHASNTTSFGPYTGIQSNSGSSFGTSNTAPMDSHSRREKLSVDNISALGDETDNDDYDAMWEHNARSASERLPPLPPTRFNPMGNIFARTRSNSSSPDIDLYSKLSSLQAELNQYNDLQKAFESLEKDFLRVKIESTEHRAKNDIYENTLKNQENTIQKLKNKNAEKDEQIDMLEQENMRMRNKLNNLEEWRIKRIQEMTIEMDLLMSLGERDNRQFFRRKSRRGIFSDVKKITGFGGVEVDDDESASTHYLHAMSSVLSRTQKDSGSSSSIQSQKRRSLIELNKQMPNRHERNEQAYANSSKDSTEEEFYLAGKKDSNSFDNRSKEDDSQNSPILNVHSIIPSTMENENQINFNISKKGEKISSSEEHEKDASIDTSTNHKFYVSDISNEGFSLPSKNTPPSNNNPTPESETNHEQTSMGQPTSNTLNFTSDEETNSLPSKISLQSTLNSAKTEENHAIKQTSAIGKFPEDALSREPTAINFFTSEEYTREQTATNVFQFPNPYKEEDSITAVDHEIQSSNNECEDSFDMDWGERQLERRRVQKETEQQELEDQKLHAHDTTNSFGFGMFRRPGASVGNHPPPSSILGHKKTRLIDIPLSLNRRSDNTSNSSIMPHSPQQSGKRTSLWR